MASTNPVRSQSSWLTILSRLDNVPDIDRDDQFFTNYWSFTVEEGTQSPAVPVGHIADWLADKVHWDHHARFTVDRDRKTIVLDVKHDADQTCGYESEGSRAIHALIMELLDDGGIPGFGQLHRKGDCYQIPGHPCGIVIDRNASQLFGIVTMGAHLACYTWVPSEEGRQMILWVARRAHDKLIDAGKLDNTAAGGIAKVRLIFLVSSLPLVSIRRGS
jgi:hypothetical protein